MIRGALLLTFLCAFGAAKPPASAHADINAARTLFLTGRYDDASVAYQALVKDDSVAAAIGIARCARAVGKLDDAVATLTAAATRHPRAAAIYSELAGLEFERGRLTEAQRDVDAALAVDAEQPAARFLSAELHRVAGRLDEANVGYRWLIRYYNRSDSIADPEVLRWIGLGAAQYARWNRNSGEFHFLVNTLYPDILKRDPNYWPAHLEAALLFTEKYNRPDAIDELKAALATNPRAAEVHAALARIALQQFQLDSARVALDRALAINPRLLVALQLRGDERMLSTGPGAAVDVLTRARTLNPVDEETLGRLAAVHGAMEGMPGGKNGAKLDAVIQDAVARNEHCGGFFSTLGGTLDLMAKFPQAARFYEEAHRRMPQLVSVPGQLGLEYMRLGDETRARETLKEAFEIDPFNIRVKNSIEVLEVLEGYRTLETQHFVTRFDPADSLLARYVTRFLEDDVYPDLVKRLGYEPQGKSLFEIFRRAKRTTGHGWFSARLVGLPFIGTVAGCPGKMVGMASPTDGARFNWARVLKHEFVHVLNLQQTDFNIPRWYTEGLAVRYEGGGATPGSWDPMLAHRVAADSLFNLDNIQLGFARPGSGEDWALAYAQSFHYVRYMEQTYGDRAPAKMIAAYADHLDTPAALQRCFGVTQPAFEQGYRKYVASLVRRSAPPNPNSPVDTLARVTRESETALRAKDYATAESLLVYAERRYPYQADWQAGMIVVYRETKQTPKLTDLLTQRAERDADNFAIRLELARLAAERSDFEAAGRWALEALHVDVLNPEAHAILGHAAAEGRRTPQAIEEYETAISLDPKKPEWDLALAKVCVTAGKKERAREVLNGLIAKNAEYPGAKELRDSLGRAPSGQ